MTSNTNGETKTGAGGKHTATNIPIRERPQTTAAIEEAGAELKLGEFEETVSLSPSEANYIISKVLENRAAMNVQWNRTE
jgi:hypothetical protein